MKVSKLIMIPAVLIVMVSGCHKSGGVVVSPASITVVNAVVNSQPVIPVFGTTGPITYFTSAQTVGYGGFQLYSPLSGANSLYVVQNTSTDTILNGHNSYFFNGTLNLIAGGITRSSWWALIRSMLILYLCGIISPIHADSTVGIRFINLSPGSNAVSINIQGNANGSEVSSLAYKGMTSFKSYAATSAFLSNGYTFEFRDATSGTLLTSASTGNYSYLFPGGQSLPLFRNFTLALYDVPGNQQVMVVADF